MIIKTMNYHFLCIKMAMSQKLPVSGFKWKRNTFKFNERFTKKTAMKIVTKDIFLKQMQVILKTDMIYTVIYRFYQKKLKSINVINLYAICMIKRTMLPTEEP